MEKFVRQAEFGTGRLAPHRLTNELVLERVGIDKILDAPAKPAQEQTGRRRPMPGEKGRLIDDREADPVLGKDRSRPLPASARVEIVADRKSTRLNSSHV